MTNGPVAPTATARSTLHPLPLTVPASSAACGPNGNGSTAR